MKFNSKEIHFIVQCLENVQIKGKDAQFVSKLLIRFGNQFEKEVEKENAELATDTNNN